MYYTHPSSDCQQGKRLKFREYSPPPPLPSADPHLIKHKMGTCPAPGVGVSRGRLPPGLKNGGFPPASCIFFPFFSRGSGFSSLLPKFSASFFAWPSALPSFCTAFGCPPDFSPFFPFKCITVYILSRLFCLMVGKMGGHSPFFLYFPSLSPCFLAFARGRGGAVRGVSGRLVYFPD